MSFISQDAEINPTGSSFLDRFAEIPGAIESRIPTFDRSLDA